MKSVKRHANRGNVMKSGNMKMMATHSVKDEDDKAIGFMINNQFISNETIKAEIYEVDNLAVQENGEIREREALPEAYYGDVVIKAAYKKIVQENQFRRDVQKEFERWRKSGYAQVLQVDGPRQVGKTTELLKFAYKNYGHVIYVNLAMDRFGFSKIAKMPNMLLGIADYCYRANLPRYKDSRDTILIIDEIQTSAEVYNSIRDLRRDLNCDIAVTGSYLGTVLGKNGFFLPAGTLAFIDMGAISFKEFTRIFKAEKLLEGIDLYGSGNQEHYDRLNKLYGIYRQIGGYPEVVKRYIKTKSIEDSQLEIGNLLRIFKRESQNYFSQPREAEIFESVYTSALEEMCHEKRGTGKGYLELISKIAKDNTSLIVNKDEVANAVVWLTYAGLLCKCDLAVNGDIRNISRSRRMYFSDCGLVAYLSKMTTLDESAIEGILTETFVFNELRLLFHHGIAERKVIGSNVCFSVYGQYELDFMVADSNRIVYGIEVKSRGGNPLSLKVFIDHHLIDKGIVAKPTPGGHGDRFDTIPIYAVGCRFPYR